MTVTRGRIDKRQAILGAAFTVFARDGYRPASVDAVAAAAGVAKHTIYNHFGDKESLFRATVAALTAESLTRNLAAVDLLRLPTGAEDLAAVLSKVGLRLAECYCDERSQACRRLLQAEIQNLPDLQDIVREGATDKVNEALADRFARLALAGQLRLTDPAVAAEQFGALLTAPLETRSRLGSRPVPAAELTEVTQNAVQTFLRAFGND
ncbi:TetR/AcrR family transcriptional regulator [Kribbella albertanoniae]|uniref:TetR/AcrR family transcriptional regulator n=1 Tax=Kribbella albertanoniae TaxID=1266829 RepID=A0A4R4Q8P7_9ACTN|nr:TetR/AcrR family transcriptional regulator C-terminal domain-containing protein [Kribbella albertanoniae]TDC31362.1 TetR/AcrR family transcriptional regulator [Kribbella albertanoniae]